MASIQFNFNDKPQDFFMKLSARNNINDTEDTLNLIENCISNLNVLKQICKDDIAVRNKYGIYSENQLKKRAERASKKKSKQSEIKPE